MKTLVISAVLAFACESVLAEDHEFPSDPSIQVEIRRIEQQRHEMFDRDEVAHPPVARAPDVSVPQQRIDILKLAKQYDQIPHEKAPDAPQQLLVFASFSMPASSLKRLSKQTREAGGVMVLRGFKDGDVKATAKAIQEYGLSATSFQINPPAFEKYRIDVIPTVALIKAEAVNEIDGEGCALPDAYSAVSGDVSLTFALEKIGQNNSQYIQMANAYIRKLEESR